MQLLSMLGMVPAAGALLTSRRVFLGTNVRRGVAYAFVTGMLGNGGNLATLQALKLGGSAAIVYPLCGMFPLVTIVLARFWLNERLNVTQKVGCIISLVAIYMFSTGAEGASTSSALLTEAASGRPAFAWVVYSLIALALFGICGVTQKIAAVHISSELSSVCWVAGSFPVALIIVLTNSLDWHVAAQDWIIAIAWGVLVVIGMILSFAAYNRGKASVVTAIIALYPALTVTGAVFLFDEHLDNAKQVAVLLALFAGVLLTYEGQGTQVSEGAAK